jgi:TonB family protein
MKSLQTLFLLLCSGFCFAQFTPREYLDKYMLPVADKGDASSYRTSELRADGKIYDVKMFTMDGTLTYSGSFLDKEFMVREGEFIFYYPNGQKKNSSFWKNGIPQGKTSSWYANGQLKAVQEYREKYIAVVEFYDSLGNQKVSDGNGEYEEQDADETLAKRVTIRGRVKNGKKEGKFQGYLKDGTLFCEETYKDNALVKGVSFDNGKEFKYTQIIDMDYMNFMDHVRKTMRYPASARRSGVDGTTWVRIIFNESQQVERVVLVKGFFPDCDAEAVRACESYKPKPFKIRGQVTNVPSTIMPIRFKLN